MVQGGTSTRYKQFLDEKGIEDDTFDDNKIALFRIQGTSPCNMQAFQVDQVSSLFYFYVKSNNSQCNLLGGGKGKSTRCYYCFFVLRILWALLASCLVAQNFNPEKTHCVHLHAVHSAQHRLLLFFRILRAIILILLLTQGFNIFHFCRFQVLSTHPIVTS